MKAHYLTYVCLTSNPDYIFLFSGIYFWTKKPVPARIPEDFFFFLCFTEDFFTGMWFWRGSQEFLIVAAVTGIFRRNSCGTGIPRIPPDSAGFLFLPNAVWLWPATKVGFC
jgi:hypothetical protein